MLYDTERLREQVRATYHRVLKPGGRLYLADVVAQRALSLEARSNPDLWTACIARAPVKYVFQMLARAAGLTQARSIEQTGVQP